MAALDLRPDVEGRGPGRVRSWPRLAPRQGVEPVTDRDLHQLMPGGVELDLVEALAETVVTPQMRGMRVRLVSPVDRALSAREPAEIVNEVVRPGAAFALQRLAQDGVGLEEVVVDEGRRLVATHRPARRSRGAALSAPPGPASRAKRSACRLPRRESRAASPSPGRAGRRCTAGRSARQAARTWPRSYARRDTAPAPPPPRARTHRSRRVGCRSSARGIPCHPRTGR